MCSPVVMFKQQRHPPFHQDRRVPPWMYVRSTTANGRFLEAPPLVLIRQRIRRISVLVFEGAFSPSSAERTCSSIVASCSWGRGTHSNVYSRSQYDDRARDGEQRRGDVEEYAFQRDGEDDLIQSQWKSLGRARRRV